MSEQNSPEPEKPGINEGNQRAGLFCLAGALAVFLLYRFGWAEGPDNACLAWMKSLRSEGLTHRVMEISALGSIPVLILIGLVTVLYLYARGDQKTTRRIFFIMVSAEVVAYIVKHLVRRIRPLEFMDSFAAPTVGTSQEAAQDLLKTIEDGGEMINAALLVSFPSGHSMMSATIFLCIAFLLYNAAGGRGPRLVLAATAAGLIVAIGLSRVYLGVHNPSDVLAGWLGGIGWTLVWFTFFARRDRLGDSASGHGNA
ncbi:MAG: phosphatase PAP2 family protein [Planctomycetota bacterium]|nr:phosphatase PAP2 family protein [Planctomycetota bacterium]